MGRGVSALGRARVGPVGGGGRGGRLAIEKEIPLRCALPMLCRCAMLTSAALPVSQRRA
jgi:hypothetical protein